LKNYEKNWHGSKNHTRGPPVCWGEGAIANMKGKGKEEDEAGSGVDPEIEVE